ncbi:MAG: ribosome maturation factor RimM [Saezia sp.]
MMTHHLPEDAIEVARIAGAWGIKGSIRVVAYSADGDALFHAKQWYLLPPETNIAPAQPLPEKNNLPKLLTIKTAQEQGRGIRVDATEIVDRNMAEALKGFRIFLSRKSFPVLEKDEFYWIDLIGLRVLNLQKEELGVVDDLMNSGPQSILHVVYQKDGTQAERLIPFVDAHIIDVDLAKKIIQVDWQSDY